MGRTLFRCPSPPLGKEEVYISSAPSLNEGSGSLLSDLLTASGEWWRKRPVTGRRFWESCNGRNGPQKVSGSKHDFADGGAGRLGHAGQRRVYAASCSAAIVVSG